MSKTSSLSYSSEPSTIPYIYKTVIDRVRELAAEAPDKEAFVFYNIHKQRICITRQQLLDRTEGAAKRLIQAGIKKGSSVMFCMANSVEMLVMNLAVVMAGGVPFFFAGNLKDGSDFVEFIEDLNAYLLIVDANDCDDNSKIINRLWPASDDVSAFIPSVKLILCNGNVSENQHCKTLSKFLQGEVEEEVSFPKLLPEDRLAYFCSSGSTGKPKEIIYSHFTIINWTKMSDIKLEVSEKTRFFCERTFGWVVGYPRTYLTEGACRIFVDTKLTSGHHTDFLSDIIHNENCDVVYLPGYIVADLLMKPELSMKFKNVKTIILSGERILSKTFHAVKHTFCRNVVIWYGNTEAGGCALFTDEVVAEDGMIGKPLPGVEMKVVDEAGDVVSVGTQGELCLRCSWRFSGYRNMNDMFRVAVDDNNWFHTGDIAQKREDGNFVVAGRFKEMISTGTLKYFPWSIEQTLKKIEGAEHAFAVGVPDQRLHNVVCACIVPKPDAKLTVADIKKFCDESFLESPTLTGVSLKPRYHIILENVPLLRSGKIDRRGIRQIAKERLGM